MYKQKRWSFCTRYYCILIIHSTCSEQKEFVFFLHHAEEAVKSTGTGGESRWTRLQCHASCCLTCQCLETLRKAAAEADTVLQMTCGKISQRARCWLHGADKSTVEVTIWKGKTSTLDNIWGSWYISKLDCCSNRQMQVTPLSYHKDF